MINVLILNDNNHNFDGIAEAVRVPGEVEVVETSTIADAMEAIRQKVFHIVLGQIAFDGVTTGGAQIAMAAFEKDHTTGLIIDPSKIHGPGEVNEILRGMKEYFIETLNGLIRVRQKRQAIARSRAN